MAILGGRSSDTVNLAVDNYRVSGTLSGERSGAPVPRAEPQRITALGIYVYMLRCSDGSCYVGSATGHDLSPRIDQHNAGTHPGYTFWRRPVVLVWSEYFDRITDGIAVERQIKGWSRAKKEALVRSDWKAISTLSRRRAGVPKVSE